MTTIASDLPGPIRVGRPAEVLADRDERRISAIVDALSRSAAPDGAVDDEAGAAALRALLGYGDIATDQQGTAGLR